MVLRIVMGWGGVELGHDLTMLMMERNDFYYVNEHIMYFGVRFGSASPCWN